MKKLFLILLIAHSGLISSKAQESDKKVTVTFVNNSILPKKFTFVTYQPGSDNNSTEGVLMAPFGKKSFTDVVGTQIYLANSKEISVVMSGKRITSKPFWLIKSSDSNKTFNLNH